jgi:hypothetical protein
LVLGDIITAINGKNVRNSSDLYRMLDKALVSDEFARLCDCTYICAGLHDRTKAGRGSLPCTSDSLHSNLASQETGQCCCHAHTVMVVTRLYYA